MARELVLRIERAGQLLAEWELADGPLDIVVRDSASDEEVLRLAATSAASASHPPTVAVVEVEDDAASANSQEPEITASVADEEDGNEKSPRTSVKTEELPDAGAGALHSNAPPLEWEDRGDTLVGRLSEREDIASGSYDEVPHLENVEGTGDDLSIPAPEPTGELTGSELSLPVPEPTLAPVDDFTMPAPEDTDASDMSIVEGRELTGSLQPDQQTADVEQFESLTGALEEVAVVLSVWLRRNGEWIDQGQLAYGERAKLGGGHIRLVEDGSLEVSTGPWLAGSITLNDGEQQAIAPASPVQRVATAVEAMIWDAESALYVRAQVPVDDAPPVEYAGARPKVQYNPPSSDF